MSSRKDMAENGLRTALKIRKRAGTPLHEPVAVFDLVHEMGIELRFVDAPSMEGMYSRDPLVIMLSSLRPLGRMAFTCAHELGHHLFGSGMHVIEAKHGCTTKPPSRSYNTNEYLADRFAAYLLMPKLAVCNGFASRGWKIHSCSAEQVYQVAGWLGVGYETLVLHLSRSLRLINSEQEQSLSKVSPKSIRSLLAGRDFQSENLFMVDGCWTGRPVDIRVGDIVVMPRGYGVEGRVVNNVGVIDQGDIYQGSCCGVERITGPNGWSQWLRVSSQGFSGRGQFRHMPEVDDNE